MKRVFFALIGLSLIGLSGCGYTDQQQASIGGTAEVGPLPDDICRQMGRPMIVSVSVENEGDIDFAYFDTQGQLVVQKYGTGRGFTTTTSKQGKLFWTSDPSIQCDQR